MSNQAEQDLIRGSLGSQSTDNAESHASIHESSESNIVDSLSSVTTVAAAEDSKERVREVNLPQGNLRSKVRKRLQQAWHWKPKPARYDVDNPPVFSVSLNVLFAVLANRSIPRAAGVTVANLYYGQSILNHMAITFDVSFERASLVTTLMQAGYAAGMGCVCPLGDILPRRTFILGLMTFTALIWIALCVTTSFLVFCAASFLAGLSNVSPQLLLPLVGDLAPPERRGTCIAIVASGTTLGVLVARVSSGFLASVPEPDSGALSKVGSWRAVYWFGLGMQCLFVALLWVWMPDYPRKNTASGVFEGEGGDHRRNDDNEKDESVEQFENARGDENIVSAQTDQPPAPGKDQRQRGWLPCCCFWLVTYLRLLVDTIRLLPTEPLLAQAAAVAFLLSAVLGSFWSTLSFLLSGPPYNYSNTIIGLFGLLGLVGAILGPVYGRLVVDRFVPLIAALPGLLLGISGAAVGTFLGERHIAGPAVQAAATDFGTQVTQIAYRSVMYDVRPNQPNRVNTAYMLVSYMGQMTGSAVGNRLQMF
ncbi:hypothetical protein VTJ04DRAFT_4330 [Mycothermus thermophilus]|uniref:uncharacterized protein n=1 Tax=Humicola insolens TaxID=85995 RepID=UPI0037428D3B